MQDMEIKRLRERLKPREVLFFEETDSTNIRAKLAAMDGAGHGTVVLAETQSAGRGRLDRQWLSEAGKGIYLSLILRENAAPERIPFLLNACALGVCEGLALFGNAPRIKWPNDIVADGRKLCGMLAERSIAADGSAFVVMGIGINVHHTLDDFPEGVRQTATSLDLVSGRVCDRTDVVCAVLDAIDRALSLREEALFLRCAEKSATIGREIRVIGVSESYTALALGLSSDGALLVRTADGSEKRVYAGDVSVRGLMGYV